MLGLLVLSQGILAQLPPRDLLKAEKWAGVPKVCVQEFIAIEFEKDCVSIVEPGVFAPVQ